METFYECSGSLASCISKFVKGVDCLESQYRRKVTMVMFNRIMLSVGIVFVAVCAMAAVAFAKPEAQTQTRFFASTAEATKYYGKLERDRPVGTSSSSRGSGRGTITYVTETRWYSVSSGEYLGSDFFSTMTSYNTCGTVVAYPDSDWTLLESFEYLDQPSSVRRKGMFVAVKIGISSTASIGSHARLRAMKNLVESGGNYRDKNDKPRRLLSLQRVLRMRYRFKSCKILYWGDCAGFVLFDVDESKENKSIAPAVFAK